MKEVTFTNGEKLNVNDESSITFMSLSVDTFAEVDMIKEQITVENMKTVTIDGTVYTEILPTGIKAETDNDTVKVVIQTREKTFEEKVSEVLTEQSDAIMELAELATLYTVLGNTWGLPYVDQIPATITALSTFLGACLMISSANYNGEE